MNRFMLLALVLFAAAPIAGVAAEGASITFEASVDFRALRTFALVEGRIDANKPEINNRLFRQRMADAIRAALAAKGMKEVAEGAGVTVTYQISDGDFSVVERRPNVRIPGQEGTNFPVGPVPVLYTEGTLIIDISNSSNALIWRGMYRDRETKTPALSRKFSLNARKLLAKYPPKSK